MIPEDFGTQWVADLQGFGSLRESVVRAALRHVGVTESPLGSNRSPEIDGFLSPAGLKGQPWCAAFVSFVLRACGCLPGAYHVSVHAMAKAETRVTGRSAWPGDVFVQLRPDGTGHCGFVLGGDTHEIMTVEGNAQNAVRIGRRNRTKVTSYVDIDPRLRIPGVIATAAGLDGAADR